jgi:hypothetical protein
MLKEEARARSLKPNKDLLFLFRSGMIITVPEGKITKRFPVKRITKDFLGFLSQEGKVEPPAEDLGLALDINELIVEPTLNLLRQPMECALLPGIQPEGMMTDDATKPVPPKLVELCPTDPQDLTGPVFSDPMIVERFQNPFDKLPSKTFVKLNGHG